MIFKSSSLVSGVKAYIVIYKYHKYLLSISFFGKNPTPPSPKTKLTTAPTAVTIVAIKYKTEDIEGCDWSIFTVCEKTKTPIAKISVQTKALLESIL